MEVILTEDIVGVGDIGQTVKVRPGYARNFLIPRGLALEIQARSAREVQHRMRQITAKKDRLCGNAQAIAKKLAKTVVKAGLRVGTGGRVFGSIGPKDIAAKLKELGFEIDRRRVVLPEHIKKIGSHTALVKLHPEVKVEVKIEIEALAATKEQEDIETFVAKERFDTAAEDDLTELGVEDSD